MPDISSRTLFSGGDVLHPNDLGNAEVANFGNNIDNRLRAESAMYRASYSLGRGTESYTVQLSTFNLHPPYIPEHPRSSRFVPTSLSLPGSWVSTT
jgi:hypothetical protein